MLRMDRGKFLLYYILSFSILEIVTGQVYNVSLAKKFRNDDGLFTVIPGIKMYYKQGGLGIHVSFRDLFFGK